MKFVERLCEDCGTSFDVPIIEGGPGDGRPLPGTRCKLCQARHIEDEEQASREDRLRQLALRSQEWRARSGIPEHLHDFTFSSVYRDDYLAEARVFAESWAAGDTNAVLMFGNPGVGKTRLAIAAANEMLKTRPVRFLSGPLLIARLGSGSFSSPARQEAIEILTGSDALVLDDIDKARASEFAAEALFLAIDQRVDGAAPIMITANLDFDQLMSRWPEPYGSAISSRLSLFSGVRVNGEDLRGRNG